MRIHVSIEGMKCLIPEICSEPMEEGGCNGNILRAYFNQTVGRCRLFSYSGCGGNRNNFQTEQDCRNVCGDFQSKFREVVLRGIRINFGN